MIYFTAHFYALGKELGAEAAKLLIEEQAQNAWAASLPAIKTLWRARELDDVLCYVDNGCCSLARGRSRVFHDALLKRDCEVWFACDDDCECTKQTLSDAIRIARETEGICLIPYLMRDIRPEVQRTTTVVIPPDADVHELEHGSRYCACSGGGFGLVALSRPAIEAFARANQYLRWTDDDGGLKIPAFAECIEQDGSWFGEDLSFFLRVPESVPIWALLTGESRHAGAILNLAEVPVAKGGSGESDNERGRPNADGGRSGADSANAGALVGPQTLRSVQPSEPKS